MIDESARAPTGTRAGRSGPTRSGRSGRSRTSRAWLAVAAACLASCAALDQEIYLAPVAARYSRAGGGTETELLAGAVRFRRDSPRGALTHWALLPLVSHRDEPNGDSMTRFLEPLGSIRNRGTEHVNQLLPLWRYSTDVDANGERRWRFFSLPGIFWSKEPSGRIVRAFFPFGGIIENFGTFDRIEFVLFPLYLRTVRDGRTSTNWIFPIFNRTTGKGGTSGRIWPLFGHSRYEGLYDRWFFLWPFFHYQKNDLSKPEEAWETSWSFWPLFAYRTRQTYQAWTFLWPFFGYARDTATGFWAWDGPWPFVRVHGGGRHPPSEQRFRIWPFYSHYVGDGLDKRNYMWPILQFSHETYPDRVRETTYAFPIWQHWAETAADGGGESWKKLWPLYQDFHGRSGDRYAFPALNPLWHLPVIDEHYAWIYELWTEETEVRTDALHARMWGGIYRREVDRFEDRSYLLGFWSRRVYAEGGARVEADAALFGLLRWQRRFVGNDRGEVDWLAPAFPGPGWPLERSTEELPPSAGPGLVEEAARP